MIDNEGIFAEEENFDEYKVILSKELNNCDISGSKVFPLNESEYLGVLETSQKGLKLLHSRKLETQNVIELGGATIINVIYVSKTNSLVLSTNDKHLNFYDISETKLVRRFLIPDVQSFLVVNEQKDILYTGTPSGKLFSWSLKEIFSDKKITVQPSEVYKKFMIKEPIKEQEDLTCLIEISSSELIITGSNDCLIRLYQTRDNSITLIKKLECHPKGIKSITYSEAHKIIVSSAFDFDVLVWNAYLEYPVAKLVGH